MGAAAKFPNITEDAYNFAWAAVIIDSLVAAGVHHVVLSPGTQILPVSVACRQNEQIKCSVVVDERSAAFHALGLARGSQSPVLLVCSSGSAAGHYYPAVIEANLGRIPLIVLTCDKSPAEHGRAVAQTIDQERLYGTHVRAALNLRLPDETIDLVPSVMGKLVAASLWPTPGPVHLNVPFRPVADAMTRARITDLPLPPLVETPRLPLGAADLGAIADTVSASRGVIVCGPREFGPGFAEAVGALAASLRCPLLADATSGVRFGRHDRSALLAHADAFLPGVKGDSRFRPDWILRFGGTPTSAAVLGWLNTCGAEQQIVIEETDGWPDPLRHARTSRIVRAHAATACRQLQYVVEPAPTGWLQAFQDEDRRAAALLERVTSEAGRVWEAQAIGHLLDALADGDTVLVGNSMVIRDFDSFSGTSAKDIRLISNRGANGIDGGIAFLLGLARTAPRKTVGIIGDLAFSHDVGALQLAAGQNVVLIVVNNGGGAIFEYQPIAGIPEFEDFLAEPGIDIGAVALAFGWQHRAAASEGGFRAALSQALERPGANLIELVVDRAASVARHRRFTALATAPKAEVALG